eukprot:scaffold3042_cov288-Ochromonas_danica.AAC.2
MNNDIKLLKNEPFTNQPLLLTEEKEDESRHIRPLITRVSPKKVVLVPRNKAPPTTVNNPTGYNAVIAELQSKLKAINTAQESKISEPSRNVLHPSPTPGHGKLGEEKGPTTSVPVSDPKTVAQMAYDSLGREEARRVMNQQDKKYQDSKDQ